MIEGLDLDGDYFLGNVVKYIARARHKGHEIEDLEKAAWYLSRKILNLKKAQGMTPERVEGEEGKL